MKPRLTDVQTGIISYIHVTCSNSSLKLHKVNAWFHISIVLTVPLAKVQFLTMLLLMDCCDPSQFDRRYF